MLPWDLEDWITDAGADVLDKFIADATSLTPAESALYEIWLLDTEARNGGLSQYFCNHGVQQWVACQAAAQSVDLTSFAGFANAVNTVIGSCEDPYDAIQAQGAQAEDLWYSYQASVVQELRGLVENAL
jgi:hypothetical protein